MPYVGSDNDGTCKTPPPTTKTFNLHFQSSAQQQRQRAMNTRPDLTHAPKSYESGDLPPTAATATAARLSVSDAAHPHRSLPQHRGPLAVLNQDGVGHALNDTPLPSGPSSPHINAQTSSRQSSAAATPRLRPATLDIPGITKSKISPGGRIAHQDLGAKLVIVMVGLPARGKSYITKKLKRYLNWRQHDTEIFNVGEKRRVVAGPASLADQSHDPLRDAAQMAVNGNEVVVGSPPDLMLPESAAIPPTPMSAVHPDQLDQSADFFDPENKRAKEIRENVAMDTLDTLLNYILLGGGSVGIFDATNSNIQRRENIVKRIRERAGPELNILFIESICENPRLLDANMRLKLSGPDYKGKDPKEALEDFQKRVQQYEKNYTPLGQHEKDQGVPFAKIFNVGEEIHIYKGYDFLSSDVVTYLRRFHLAPRQIWITRHGESMDNVSGKIGGDSSLSPNGIKYAQALTRFVDHARHEWDIHQLDKMRRAHLPLWEGDVSPPNPDASPEEDPRTKNFCVWTSMLKRSTETAQYFDEEEYKMKEFHILNELDAGSMEGMTYAEIKAKFPEEYEKRMRDKLHYRYPGVGGEGYLDIIHRIRDVIMEVERMHDHVLLIVHRSIARILLAYFKGLSRDDVTDLDVPLGMVYAIEPKPYGVDFKAYLYNPEKDWFDLQPGYQLHRNPPGVVTI